MKPGKNQGFNGIRTRDLRDTGAMLYQLSYEAHGFESHWSPDFFFNYCSYFNILLFVYQSVYDFFLDSAQHWKQAKMQRRKRSKICGRN